MASLVPVPYQPGYYGTPQAVALLLNACGRAGHNIPLTDAWRPYAEQKYYWDGWVKRLPGFNLASNPDDPKAQNNHLRGEAFDIRDHGDRAAMLAVGFTPDAVEWWHFNEPGWKTAPIIRDLTTAASIYVTYLDTPTEEDILPMNIVLYLYVPTNKLLLVDHMNKTIRDLGNGGGSLREYYSRQRYIKAYDPNDNRRNATAGDVVWAEVVDGYTYK